MVDFIRPTPRNRFVGLLADAAERTRGATGAVGDFLLGGAPETLDNLSYGVPPVRLGDTGQGLMGAINGMRVDPGVADVAGLLSATPLAAKAGKAAGREALSAVNEGMMGRGLLSGPLSPVAPSFMLKNRYTHPNLGERVSVPVIPDESERLMRLALDGGSLNLHLNPTLMRDKAWVRNNGINNAVADFLWPFDSDVYVRSGHMDDFRHLKSGTHRGSINHATGESEGGLSVSRTLGYPGEKSYLVRGRRAGDGSDGEPLLSMDGLDVVSGALDESELRAMYERALKDHMQKLGLDEADRRALRSAIDLQFP